MERSLLSCLLLLSAAIQHGCGGGLGGQLWCLQNTYVDMAQGVIIIWPKTRAGQQARANCTNGTTGTGVYRRCTLQGTWEDPDFTQCTSDTTADLVVWKTLEAFKTGSPQNRTKTLTHVVGVLEDIVMKKDKLNETADSIMATVEVIMEMNKTILGASGNISSRVLRVLDLLAKNIPTDKKTKTKVLKTRNLVLQAIDVNKENFKGFLFDVTTNGNFSNNFDNSKTSIKLSSSVLDNAGTGLVRIGFIYFGNNKLFQENEDKNYITSEEVVSSSVYNISTSNLADPVVVRFPTQAGVNMGNKSCVFWKDKARQWSSAGCSLCPRQSSKDSVECCCNHLTSFAVLFSPEKKPSSEDDDIHAKILSIISYVGCVISLVGVILTFLTYVVFGHLRKTNQQYILMNLCIAIALLLIVFVAGINSTNNILGCQIVAVLLHYLTLVTVLWMGIEAYNLYLGIVKVLDTYHSRFMLKASLVGWGVPLLIVLATVIAAVVEYNNVDKTFMYGSEHACVLHKYLYSIIAWFVPILAILLFNVVIFIRVMHRLRNSLAVNYNKDTCNSKTQCWTAIAIMCLLGLTWLFGALAISDARIVFEYLFCIFNSLQGFFIFFFHCLRIKEVRSQWSVFVSGLGLSRRESVTSEGCNPRRRSKEKETCDKKEET